jgi:hypothetical protein
MSFISDTSVKGKGQHELEFTTGPNNHFYFDHF